MIPVYDRNLFQCVLLVIFRRTIRVFSIGVIRSIATIG